MCIYVKSCCPVSVFGGWVWGFTSLERHYDCLSYGSRYSDVIWQSPGLFMSIALTPAFLIIHLLGFTLLQVLGFGQFWAFPASTWSIWQPVSIPLVLIKWTRECIHCIHRGWEKRRLIKWLCFLVLEELKTALIQNVGKIDCLHYFDFFRKWIDEVIRFEAMPQKYIMLCFWNPSATGTLCSGLCPG